MRYKFTVKDAAGEIIAVNETGDSSIMGIIQKALNKGHQITVHSARYDAAQKAIRKPELAE